MYVWADGIFVKAGLERDKAALLAVIGAMIDDTKEVLALTSASRESTHSWTAVFRGLVPGSSESHVVWLRIDVCPCFCGIERLGKHQAHHLHESDIDSHFLLTLHLPTRGTTKRRSTHEIHPRFKSADSSGLDRGSAPRPRHRAGQWDRGIQVGMGQ